MVKYGENEIPHPKNVDSLWIKVVGEGVKDENTILYSGIRARTREKEKAITFPRHDLHRTKAIPLPHSPIRPNAIRARFGLLPCLAKQTNLRKQVTQ